MIFDIPLKMVIQIMPIFKENLKGLESQLQLSIDRKVQSLHAEINAVTELFNRAEGNSSW